MPLKYIKIHNKFFFKFRINSKLNHDIRYLSPGVSNHTPRSQVFTPSPAYKHLLGAGFFFFLPPHHCEIAKTREYERRHNNQEYDNTLPPRSSRRRKTLSSRRMMTDAREPDA